MTARFHVVAFAGPVANAAIGVKVDAGDVQAVTHHHQRVAHLVKKNQEQKTDHAPGSKRKPVKNNAPRGVRT